MDRRTTTNIPIGDTRSVTLVQLAAWLGVPVRRVEVLPDGNLRVHVVPPAPSGFNNR